MIIVVVSVIGGFVIVTVISLTFVIVTAVRRRREARDNVYTRTINAGPDVGEVSKERIVPHVRMSFRNVAFHRGSDDGYDHTIRSV